jgi:hypothetical protein
MEDHEKHRPEHSLVEPMFAALLEQRDGSKTRASRVRLAVLLVAVGVVVAIAVFVAA